MGLVTFDKLAGLFELIAGTPLDVFAFLLDSMGKSKEIRKDIRKGTVEIHKFDLCLETIS